MPPQLVHVFHAQLLCIGKSRLQLNAFLMM
jgi:hypothetical protein